MEFALHNSNSNKERSAHVTINGFSMQRGIGTVWNAGDDSFGIQFNIEVA